MSVSAIGLLNNFSWTEYSNRASSVTVDSVLDGGTGQGTTVTISNAGQKALAAQQGQETSQTKSLQDAEVPKDGRKYASPGWLADYCFVSPSTLQKGDWFSSYYPKAAAAPELVCKEYSKKVDEYFVEALKENGLDGAPIEDRYRALFLDQEKGNQIRQTFVDKMQNDPKMVRLMNEFGMPSTQWRTWPDASDDDINGSENISGAAEGRSNQSIKTMSVVGTALLSTLKRFEMDSVSEMLNILENH